MPSTEADYLFLRQLLLERSHNVLDPSRNDLFDSRLYRLLQAQNMAGLDELVLKIRFGADPSLEQAVVEAMTINETSFFRDHAVFELLRSSLLPRLFETRAADRQLRLWSAACSSGQEAYSLAMLLRSHFSQLADWDIEITGTDIHAEMIRWAQRGRYRRMEINRGLPAHFLLRYFKRDGEEWEIHSELRSMCRFQQQNLAHPLPVLKRYDLILLRNVLFYFPDQTQRRVLEKMHLALQTNGILILGSSEQASPHELWRPMFEGNICYYEPR